MTPMERVMGFPADPPENPTHTLENKIHRLLRRLQLHPSAAPNGFTRIPSLAYTDVDHGYDTIDIPTEWNSAQHLQFCGLRPEVADRFHAQWKVLHAADEVDGWLKGSAVDGCLVDIVLEGIHTARYDELYADGDWKGALAELGLTTDVVNAIMDPRYEKLRKLGDPLHWAVDTIATNHDFLVELNRRVRARKEHLVKLRSICEKEWDPAPMNLGLHDTDESKVYYLPLRAHDVGKLIGVLDNTQPGFLSSISEVHPTAQHYIHLLQDKALALEMASYTASRCRAKEAVVLHVSVPTAIVAQARKDVMSWEEWQRLVWFSRNVRVREEARGALPTALHQYAERSIVEVPVCGLSEARVSALQSEEEIEALTRDDGAVSHQLVFQGLEARMLWYEYSTHEIHAQWVTDVASQMSPEFILSKDISKGEWDARKMDCWNGWRWNERPAMKW